jgi:hypothetical protein
MHHGFQFENLQIFCCIRPRCSHICHKCVFILTIKPLESISVCNTFLIFCPQVWQKVSYPYKTTGKTTVLCNLVFSVLEDGQNDTRFEMNNKQWICFLRPLQDSLDWITRGTAFVHWRKIESHKHRTSWSDIKIQPNWKTNLKRMERDRLP